MIGIIIIPGRFFCLCVAILATETDLWVTGEKLTQTQFEERVNKLEYKPLLAYLVSIVFWYGVFKFFEQ